MSREQERPPNLCTVCHVMDIAPCPLLERAYDKGYSGMNRCEMFEIVKKLVAQIRFNAKLGPKGKGNE